MKRKSDPSKIPTCCDKKACNSRYCERSTSTDTSSMFDDSVFRTMSQISQISQTDHQSSNVTKWLNDFQVLSSNEKNLALGAITKTCNITQLRALKEQIDPHFQRDFISQLPKEITMKVLNYLSAADLVQASATCHSWRTLCEDVVLWRQKFPDHHLWPPVKNSADQGCTSSSLVARCPAKASFVRCQTVLAKWRRGEPKRRIVLRGHDDHVITCVQVYDNGRRVVSGSDDNTLKVWSTETEQCLHTLAGHTGGVWCSQVTSDGHLIVSGSTDRTVRVWDALGGKCLFTLVGHTSTVRCMALNGDTLVSGSRDATLRVWNVRQGEYLFTLSGHSAAIRCVQFDGRRAVSGSYDFTVKVWDVDRRCCMHTLVGHTDRVYSLQFDGLRGLIASGSLDSSIRVWDATDGRSLSTLVGHRSLTSGMALNGDTLVSGNADSTVRVWDVRQGRCIHTLSGENKHNSAVTSLQLLTGARLVATSSDDGYVKLWDTHDGTFIRDLLKLPSSGGSGGCIWRLKATPTMLICAVGSRNGTEDTKLIIFDFDADCP